MSLRLLFAGDVMLGENEHHVGRGIPTRWAGRFDKLIPEAFRQEVLSRADFLFLNFEASLRPPGLCADNEPSHQAYRCPPEALDFLERLPCTVVANVANNHFGQYGRESAAATISALESRAIHCTGLGPNPLVLQKHGQTLRIWGINTVPSYRADGDVGWICDLARLPDQLRLPASKPRGECWIVLIHWGDEYRCLPSREQRICAERLARKGVDLIAGHHPHVIQPVEKMGQALVCFSLGNLLFDQDFSSLTRTGLLVDVGWPGGKTDLIMTEQHRHALTRWRSLQPEELSAWCRRHDAVWNPERMRVAMKLELFRHYFAVPRPVRRHFLRRFLRRLLLN